MKIITRLFFFSILVFSQLNLEAQFRSLNFDGIDDYVEFGDQFDFGTSDFTIEFWFKADNIIAGMNNTGTKLLNKGISIYGTPQNAGYGFRLVDIGATNELRFMIHDGAQLYEAVATGIMENVWYHVAGVRQGNSIKLYVNGSEEQAVSPMSLGNLNTNLSFALGALVRQPFLFNREFFDGNIDDVRIWNTARTEMQIANNYEVVLTGTEQDLIAYWPADQGVVNGDNGSGCPSSNPCVDELLDIAGSTNGDLVNFSLMGSSSNWTGSAPALPVELTKFQATIVEHNVVLKWETLSETNNQGFEVLHSHNGKEWNKLDFIPGAGTTIQTNNYQFVDKEPIFGINYYRLKQVDFDGKFSYSEIQVINFAKRLDKLQLYPNPVQNILNLNVASLNLKDVSSQLKIFDTFGKQVMEIGTNQPITETINVSSLPAGIYQLVIVQDKTTLRSSFIKH